MMGDERGGVVSRRKDRPALEPAVAREREQERDALALVRRPGEDVAREARASGEPVVVLGDRHADAAAPEAADDPEPAVVAADDEGADRAHRPTTGRPG